MFLILICFSIPTDKHSAVRWASNLIPSWHQQPSGSAILMMTITWMSHVCWQHCGHMTQHRIGTWASPVYDHTLSLRVTSQTNRRGSCLQLAERAFACLAGWHSRWSQLPGKDDDENDDCVSLRHPDTQSHVLYNFHFLTHPLWVI